MPVKTETLTFDGAEDRTTKFDTWMLTHASVDIKAAILSSDQALIIYEEEETDADT